MQQRQPRLGDILDDYCPRERRLTNHAVVAMIGEDIRLTRCTTCDAEHDYKQARVPRLRKKDEPASVGALGLPVPRRIAVETQAADPSETLSAAEATSNAHEPSHASPPVDDEERAAGAADNADSESADDPPPPRVEEGPVHRQLIRAQLPRHEGQPPMPRQAPDFTIRQPGGRPNRFRQQRSDGMFYGGGNRSFGSGGDHGNGNGSRGAGPRPSGRPPIAARAANRHGGGRKRSK